MSNRTRRVAIDGNGQFSSVNQWTQSSQNDPLTFSVDQKFFEFEIGFSIKLGGNGQTFSAVTVWANGLVSMGSATQAQIDFVYSGQNVLRTNDDFAAGFPGQFFFLNTNANTEQTGFVEFEYAFGFSAYAPFQVKRPVAFFEFGGAQIVFDEAGFTMFNGAAGNSMGYKIADKLLLTRDSVFDVDIYIDFLTISGGAGNDSVNGTDFADILIGGIGNDTLNGGDGNDVLNGGAGADTLNGGAGNNTADYRTSSTGVSVNLLTSAVSGGDAQGDILSGFNTVFGSAFADNLVGGSSQALFGFGGDDILRGGGSTTRLNGGAGADQLLSNSGTGIADYRDSPAGVTVNLLTATGTGGDAQGDTFSGISGIDGSAFDDVLTGNRLFATTIFGAAGNDTLLGGNLADILSGGDGDDILTGGTGGDFLTGGSGNDTASYRGSNAAVTVNLATFAASGGHAAGDVFNAQSGIESLEGSAFNDTLTGNDNNNTIEGGAGADTLNGGAGLADILKYASSDAGVSVNLLTNVVSGGHAAGDVVSNFEGIIGSAFADTLNGNSADNVISGGGGVDTINGSSGFDQLFGDAGNDIIDGGTGGDFIYGGADDDRLDGGAGVFFDSLFGEGGNDVLLGGDGDDVLTGGAGGDVLNGGAGNDTASYASSTGGVTIELDTQRARDNDAQGDSLVSIENLTGSGFADTLVGDANGNSIFGANGDDLIVGQDGDDSLTGGEGIDTIVGGIGNDGIGGGNGNDILIGELGDDVLDGGAGNDMLNGGADADTLSGDAGDDVLEGGTGADTLSGGDGFDLLLYRNSAAAVAINLSALTATGGEAEGDILRTETVFDPFSNTTSEILKIEGVIGSAFADALTGNDDDNAFEGGGGADTLAGGNGTDTLSYAGSAAGVIVNLTAGTASGGDAQGDVFSGFENLTGSAQADQLIGNTAANTLLGNGGSDILIGGGGSDIIDGGAGVDEARYSGARKSYVITTVQESTGTGFRVAEGPETGTDTLRGIEQMRFADGTLTFDGTSQAAILMRIYSSGLDRAPDAEGFQHFLGQLAGGVTIRSIASFIASSPEFIASFGNLNNEQFVQQLYRSAFNREGSPGEIAQWVPLLAKGDDRGDILLAISESPEHLAATAERLAAGLWIADQTALVAARMYDTALGRLPDTGVTGWIEFLKSGQSVVAMAAAFIQAPEFVSRFGNLTDRQFVEQMYLFALERPGDEAGITGWVQFLAAGNSRAQVLAGFSESAEHIRLSDPLWFDGLNLSPIGSVEIDRLVGTTGIDRLEGLGKDDRLFGLAGNDVLVGGAGSDFLDGGEGFDASVYAGFVKSYRIGTVQSSDGLTNLIANGAEGGTDTLLGIEEARFADGVRTFDPGSSAAKILRLYDAGLDRLPTAAEYEQTLAQAAAGVPFIQIALNLVNSAEYADRFGTLTHQQFVGQLYRIALNREGSAAEIASWVGLLDKGDTRGQILSAFAESPDHIALTAPFLANGIWIGDETMKMAARMYDSALGRLPDSGLTGWTNFLKSGQSVLDMANLFINAPEFVSRFGNLSNQAFVEQLYQFTLRRTGNAAEVQGWVDFIASGQTRAEVLTLFSESPEHVGLTAPSWYNGISLLDQLPQSSQAALSETVVLEDTTQFDLDALFGIQPGDPMPAATIEAEWEAALDTIAGADQPALARLFNDSTFKTPVSLPAEVMIYSGSNLDHIVSEILI